MLAAFILVGCFGLALRFHGFATRLFWTDEGITAIRIAGHTTQQFTAEFVDGRPHRVSEFMAFVGAQRGGTRDVLRSLAVEDAQHAPVYYVIAAWWTRMFGPSIASLRLLSVLIGCLVPFAVGWLCFELYGTRMAAALGFAISSLSPVLLIYSQQAREYALWAFFIALASAVCLRAIRARRAAWWIGYAFTMLLGIYTDTLFFTVFITHAILAAAVLRGRALRAFAIAWVAAGLAFAPWAFAILTHWRIIQIQNAGTASPWPLRMLLGKWIFNAGTPIFDLEFARAALAIVLLPVFVLYGAALVWNFSQGALRKRVFTLGFIVLPALLVLPDLVLHQHRSTVTRYGIALWVALIVCIAGYLAQRLRASRRSPMWLAVIAAVLAVEAWSSIGDVRASIWWDNRGDAQDVPLARVLNAPPPPLVVVPGNWARVLALSFSLHRDVAFEMVPLHAVTRPQPGFARALLLARESEYPAFANSGQRFSPIFSSRETNAQIRMFRGTDTGREYLSLWRFDDYAGTPP